MYSYEIKNLLINCNYFVDQQQLKLITDVKQCPQLQVIRYLGDNEFDMWDNKNNYFKFKVKKLERR